MHRNIADPPYGEKTCIATLHSLLREKHLHRNITLTLKGETPASQQYIYSTGRNTLIATSHIQDEY